MTPRRRIDYWLYQPVLHGVDVVFVALVFTCKGYALYVICTSYLHVLSCTSYLAHMFVAGPYFALQVLRNKHVPIKHSSKVARFNIFCTQSGVDNRSYGKTEQLNEIDISGRYIYLGIYLACNIR